MYLVRGWSDLNHGGGGSGELPTKSENSGNLWETSGEPLDYRSIQIDYRQRFFRGTLISSYTESCCHKNSCTLQRQICGNVSRKSLITDTDSLLNSH